ncbi:MAG: tRNA (adenosine(37)-N6)-dimethylallyltransferase MiaA [Hyphomicrobiaceae bacterium]|nr:tRNA (adenosine(37)-N6)-dimethylallyltransferase MiaA [Hyphomicrobiaceae bacterium]
MSRPQRPAAILIAGPTASGKSGIALAIAKARGGVVINADSMQVYRELRILTARPSRADEAAAPHRLYGHISASEPYSVARWLADVAVEIDSARSANLLPIIVGGTGLYFKALLEGLSPVPEIPREVRERWRAAGATLPAADLHAELSNRDRETAAALRPSDRQRLVRALEVIEATGTPLVAWHRIKGQPLLALADVAALVVERPREELYRRSDARFRAMVAEGALDEARHVRDMALSPELPASRALGLAPLIDHLDGRLTIDAATAVAAADTRHYIKRQATWLRRHMIAWRSVAAQEMETQLSDIFSFSDFCD